MYTIRNFQENENIKSLANLGAFVVLEHQVDLSVAKEQAIQEYYASKMNVKKKQLLCDLSKSNVILQAGAMQWMVGDVNMNSGVKGAGDLIRKMFKGAVTKESVIKPEYTGTGKVILEPTYKHIILLDVGEWGGSLTVEDGMFLASEASLSQKVVMRSNLSSAALGGEGLFNLSLNGSGIVALESDVPIQELIEIELNNDVLKIDGNMAVAWTSGLQFTVERASRNLIGSAASGEGLVNVYKGTGRVLMAPVQSAPKPLLPTK